MNQVELNNKIELFIKEKGIRGYSPDELAFINKYEGSGGQISKGAKSTARGEKNPLYEYYTPEYIAEYMFKLAEKYGYDGGNVLEPSCATGRLIRYIPDKSKVVGFEITEISSKIAKINYPEADIYNQYFETAFMEAPKYRARLKKDITWLRQYPFSLIIGNPPFGKYKSFYSSHFNKPKFEQVEQFFIYYAMLLLKKGGILVYLISQNFMRSGDTYKEAKETIGKIATLKDSYRLPPIFKNTGTPIDIIVLTKK